jgi:LmbE family N-acetylglucosaminyl deacetylase
MQVHRRLIRAAGGATHAHSVTAAPSPEFDPGRPGASEASWQSFLRTQPLWEPEPVPAIVVSPHPDDEVLGAGGLIHTLTARGAVVRVVSVTDGEAAYADAPGPGASELGVKRRGELRWALRKLCSQHVETLRLAIPDGEVRNFENKLFASIESMITPATLIIAPFEEDGHPDHDAAGRVACRIARAHGLAMVRYPIWAWHQSDPEKVRRLPWRRFPLTPEAQRAKARALECFASQTSPGFSAPILPPHVLQYFQRTFEAFV